MRIISPPEVTKLIGVSPVSGHEETDFCPAFGVLEKVRLVSVEVKAEVRTTVCAVVEIEVDAIVR